MAATRFKICPNCGADRFFVDNELDGFVFIHAGLDGLFYSTKDGTSLIALQDTSDLYCVSCGWHGTEDELGMPE